MNTDDCIVNIVFDRTRINAKKSEESARRRASVESITLCFICIKLENGEYEYLASDIGYEVCNKEEINQLYQMSWGIESVFDDLKNKLQIENFTGEKPITIEQDIATELSDSGTQKQKYEMQLNRNIGIGIIKEELILTLMEKRLSKRKQ